MLEEKKILLLATLRHFEANAAPLYQQLTVGGTASVEFTRQLNREARRLEASFPCAAFRDQLVQACCNSQVEKFMSAFI